VGALDAGIGGFDYGGDAAAGAEVADYFSPDGVAGFDDVVEDLVDDVLLEDAEVAVGEEVFLEGLQLEAGLARHVANGDAAEVGEAGFGADGGELGVVDQDLVGFELVAPGFNGRKCGVEASLGVVVGVAGGFGGFCGHGSILSRGGRGWLGLKDCWRGCSDLKLWQTEWR
jgi:hypothetical protein